MDKINKPLISIAPMIDISNTHFRYFIRLITSCSTIYTQMIHHNAILNHHKALLPFHPSQHPIVLQLGGCDPIKLADAAQIGVHYGYDQINLNVGCPSPRVQEGSFGACLMKEPQLVYDCMREMKQRVKGTSCTVKCRLGVDEFDSYQFVKNFISEVSKNGNVEHFVVHARKAFLKGLNPSQNRNVPPLWYDRVFQLKQDFPYLKFTINGGIKTISQAKKILDQHNLQGCMIGRMAYQNPYQLITADSVIYNQKTSQTLPTRQQLLLKYSDYLDHIQNLGYFNNIGLTQQKNQSQIDPLLGFNINTIKHHQVNPSVLIKPIINLFHGIKYSSSYKQVLSDPKKLKSEPLSNVIKEALTLMHSKIKQTTGKQSENQQIIQHIVNGD